MSKEQRKKLNKTLDFTADILEGVLHVAGELIVGTCTSFLGGRPTRRSRSIRAPREPRAQRVSYPAVYHQCRPPRPVVIIVKGGEIGW